MRKTHDDFRSSRLFAFTLLVALFFSSPLLAQQTSTEQLPDAPGATPSVGAFSSSIDDQQTSGGAQNAAAQPPHEDPQQKRIFGIIPNFRAVTAGTKLPPQTIKDKFVTASQDSFDYSSLTLAVAVSLESYVANDTPEFHTGGAAFGRYLWHSYTDEVSENYWVEFIVPSITHEDTRYYSLGHGGFVKRTGYALSRSVVTLTDSGHTTFNASEVIGAGAAAGISNFYYPRPERTLSNTLDKWGVNVGIDAASFFFREFYPDIYHAMFHHKDEPSAAPSGK